MRVVRTCWVQGLGACERPEFLKPRVPRPRSVPEILTPLARLMEDVPGAAAEVGAGRRVGGEDLESRGGVESSYQSGCPSSVFFWKLSAGARASMRLRGRVLGLGLMLLGF